MELLAEFDIPERVRIKKNGKRIFSRKYYARPIVTSSKQYLEWEAKAIWHLKKQWHPAKKAFDFPMEVHFDFYFENHQSEPDTSNCVEGPQDCLQMAHIITNDKLIHKVVAQKHFGHEPKTKIRIFKLEDTSVLRAKAA